MTKTVSNGYTDTPISGVTGMALTLPVVNFEKDYRVLSESPTEVIITNVNAPVGQSSTFRTAIRPNKNVYAGSDISLSDQLPLKAGNDILIQLRETLSFVDSSVASAPVLFPISVGITLTVPTFGELSADKVKSELLRAVAGVFEQDDSGTEGITALLHGVLAKKVM